MLKAILLGAIICGHFFAKDLHADNPGDSSAGRAVINGHSVVTAASDVPIKKMSTGDSIKLAYREAMQSKRIETLEAYLNHYATPRYRPYQKILKLSSVRTALRLLRADAAAQAAFNRRHPCFGESADTLTINIKGLSTLSQKAFTGAWYNLRNEVAQLPSIRLPASLDIDYTSQPPVLMLRAVVSPKYDIEQSGGNLHRAYRISCLQPAMRLLQRLKLLSAIMLHEQRTSGKENDDIIDYEVKKVRAATYAVCLAKPDTTGVIIFYARENRGEAIDTNHLVEFYEFYDLSTARRASRRFPLRRDLLPEVIQPQASDSVELIMQADFFRKSRPKPVVKN